MEKLEVGQVWTTELGGRYAIKEIEGGWIGFEDTRGHYQANTLWRFEHALKVTGAKLEGRDGD